MSALESKLRRLAASLDAAALEALASKGLLRRAQKDLERGVETRIAGETGTSLRVCVGEFEVTLPESGPATATCSCPAAGVCQHILAAVIFLQKPSPESGQAQLPGVIIPEAKDNPDREWMTITPEQLEQWAGKASFKAGLKLAGQCMPEVLRERAIRIHFPTLNSEVHFVPGGGLDGMIVSGGKGDGSQLVVAAVVGFQRAQGTEWTMLAEVTALEASEGAPRSRLEVLHACQTLLDETLSNGLSRLSAANQQRWATLAVSALGVNLPRLALCLRGIGDEAALVLSRDARSDLARMLGRMAQAHALCTALQNGGENPRPDLVGLHRTRYDEVGHLDLVGVAAWPWRTASGYEGLTVLFWDPSAKRWNSWTESRPRHQLADFKPAARYTQPGPWEGAESPRQLSRSGFRLMNARRNPGNRLSGSSKSRVLVTEPANLIQSGLVGIEDWSQLQQQSNAQTSFGLMEANPLDAVFALKPAVWGQHGYDPIRQIFAWVLADAQQHPLLLEITFDEFAEPAIRFLETVPPASLQGALVIGRVQRTPRGLSFHPYSLHQQNGHVVHLCLDNVNAIATPAIPIADATDEGFEEEEEAESATIFSPAMSRLLDEVEDGLLALAESGLAALNPLRVERVRQIAPRTERLGLQGLATGLGNMVARPNSSGVLRCSYLSQLHRRALPFST
jgi:hypothetical protein